MLRLSGGSSSLVYSLMYRYICIDFGYLSVIISSTGLNLLEALSWTGANLSPIPLSQRARTHFSSLLLPPFVSSPVTYFHKPHVIAGSLIMPCCGAMTQSQAPSVSLSDSYWRPITLLQPNSCVLDLLSTTWRQNGSKLYTELGPFLTCSMEM